MQKFIFKHFFSFQSSNNLLNLTSESYLGFHINPPNEIEKKDFEAAIQTNNINVKQYFQQKKINPFLNHVVETLYNIHVDSDNSVYKIKYFINANISA